MGDAKKPPLLIQAASHASGPASNITWGMITNVLSEGIKSRGGIAAAIASIDPTLGVSVLAIFTTLGLARWYKNKRDETQEQAFLLRLETLADKSAKATDVLKDIADGTIELKVELDAFVKQDIADVVTATLASPQSNLREGLREEFADLLKNHATSQQLSAFTTALPDSIEELRVLAWTNDARGREMLELIKEIHARAKHDAERKAARSPATSTVPALSPTFIARSEITKTIHEALNVPGPKGVVRQAAARAFGGYGKTVAALLYAHEYREHYPKGTFFLSMSQGTLVDALARLCEPLGLPVNLPPPQAAATVKHALETATNPDGAPAASLLIIDNIDTKERWDELSSERIPGDARPLLPRGNCRVLITTRVKGLPQSKEIAIGRLTPKEAREVYARFCRDAHTGESDGRDAPDDETADTITQLLGGLAVAVAAVAARLKLSPERSWSAYATNLANLTLDQLPDVSPEVRDEIGTDATALAERRRTLHVINDAINALPPPARRAVEYAALLPQDMVPRPWLEWMLDHDASEPATNADGTPNPLALAMPKPADLPGSPAPAVIRQLERLDVLVQCGEDGKLLSLHRLWHTQLSQLSRDSDAELDPLWLTISRHTDTRYSDLVTGNEGDGRGHPSYPQIAQRREDIWELGPLSHLCVSYWDRRRLAEAANLAYWLSSCLHTVGRFEDALTVLEPLKDHEAEVIDCVGSRPAMALYGNLAAVYVDVNERTKAVESHIAMVKLLKSQSVVSLADLTAAHSQSAHIYERFKMYIEALEQIDQATSIAPKSSPEDKKLLGGLLLNRCRVLCRLERLTEASECVAETERLWDGTFLSGDIDEGRILFARAMILQFDNKKQESKHLYHQALAIFTAHKPNADHLAKLTLHNLNLLNTLD